MARASLILFTAASVLCLTACDDGNQEDDMFGRRKNKTVSLENQLETLAECGIALRPERTIDELLLSHDRATYEGDPYNYLVPVMADVVPREPFEEEFSDDLCGIGLDDFTDQGDYAEVVAGLAELAGGAFPATNPRDGLDLIAETAWVEFELDGQTHRYEPVVEGDYFDPGVLVWIDGLVRARGSDGVFVLFDSDFHIVAFCTPEQFGRLRSASTQFRWVAE